MSQKQNLNIEAFNWCIENDFQVYLVPVDPNGKGKYKIAVRRRGITTEGKDYSYVNGVKIDSKLSEGDMVFKNSIEASNYLNNVYEHLRRTYG